MGASAWIGPAIIAAVISAVITAFGWYASHVSNRRLDSARRRERIKDIQTALRAEIRSHRRWLESFDVETENQMLAARMASDASFTPFVPTEPDTFIFNAIVGEIHILPSEVIDPIVLYYRQIIALGKFAEDLRGERFEALASPRRQEMWQDYIALGVYALDLADETIVTLSQSLDAKVNSPVLGRSDP